MVNGSIESKKKLSPQECHRREKIENEHKQKRFAVWETLKEKYWNLQ